MQEFWIIIARRDISWKKELRSRFWWILGVMTAEGAIVRSRYDKFRQINRYLEFVEDILPELDKDRELTLIDFGCGKSYLTFALYYYLTVKKQYRIRMIGLDLKKDVMEHCQELAEKYGYDRLTFLTGDIADYDGVDQVDMVVSLHACDTATDYALEKALQWNAKVIFAVPCCHHELNRQMHSSRQHESGLKIWADSGTYGGFDDRCFSGGCTGTGRISGAGAGVY